MARLAGRGHVGEQTVQETVGGGGGVGPGRLLLGSEWRPSFGFGIGKGGQQLRQEVDAAVRKLPGL